MTSLAALLSVGLTAFSGPVRMKAIDGQWVTPLVDRTKYSVLFFITEECPISRAYAAEIGRISREFAGFRFFLVHEDADTTVSRAKAYGKSYGLAMPTLLDRGHRLARELGIKIVPTATVVSPKGGRCYVGRIDNRYPDLGLPPRTPTVRDLRLSLTGVRDGNPPKLVTKPSVGCTISY